MHPGTTNSAQKQAYEQEKARITDLFQAAAAGDLQAYERCVNSTEREGVIEYRDANQRNVLHFAASFGHAKFCKKLIEDLKTDSNRRDGLSQVDSNGDTPLALACQFAQVETAKLLFEAAKGCGAPIEGDEPESKEELKNKTSLLHKAASSGNVDMVRTAIHDFGLTDINRRSSVGTPLFWAAFNGNASIVKVLLQAGADPNARDNDGLSPLLISVTKDSKETVRELVLAGAELDICTEKEGETTVLHAGAASGAMKALKALIDTDISNSKRCAAVRDKAGLRPIELAGYAGHREVVKLLCTLEDGDGNEEREVDAVMAQMLALREKDETDADKQVEEVSKVCDGAKSAGNEFFKSGKTEEALEQYTIGIEAAEKLMVSLKNQNERLCSEKSATRLERFKEDMMALLLCNRSACFLKVDSKDGAESAQRDAEEAISYRKWPKAYYRLGQALSAQEMHADAAQAFWTGYELDPKDAGANALLSLFKRAVKLAKQGEDEAGAQIDKSLAAGKIFEFNLPVEIPIDSHPNAPLRSLTLSFNRGEDPTLVAGRFIQENRLDPSLVGRIAQHVNEYMRSL